MKLARSCRSCFSLCIHLLINSFTYLFNDELEVFLSVLLNDRSLSLISVVIVASDVLLKRERPAAH